MKWRVRRSDGNDTVIEADRVDATPEGLIFRRAARTSGGFVEVARFAPAGWLWWVAVNESDPVEVSGFQLSPEFTQQAPASPNVGQKT